MIIDPSRGPFEATLAPVPPHWGGLGAIDLPDDPRDYPPEAHPRAARILFAGAPPTADRSRGVCEILNQGQTAACVPHSTAGGIQLDNNLDRSVCYHFDAMHLYHELGGTGANGIDSRQCLQKCVDDGAPLIGGGRVKIGSYFRCDNAVGVFEEQVKAAISGGMVVVLAMLLPTTFGAVWRPGQVSQGYHQVELSGYEGRLFWGPNSWGSGWGGARGYPGFYECSFDYVIANNFQAGYAYAFFFDPFEAHAPEPAPTPSPTPTPIPTPTPSPTPDPSGFAAEVFRLQNQARAAAGLPALLLHPALVKSAQDYAQWEGANNQYGHEADGKTPLQRMIAAGLPATGWSNWGENIAAGESEPGADLEHWGGGWETSAHLGERGKWEALIEARPGGAMTDWLNSPGHKANILFPAFTHCGIGVAEVPGSQYRWYWCVDFVALGDQPAPTPTPTPTPTPQPQPSKVTVSGIAEGTGIVSLQVGQRLQLGSGDVQLSLTSVIRQTPTPTPTPTPEPPTPTPDPGPSPGGLTVAMNFIPRQSNTNVFVSVTEPGSSDQYGVLVTVRNASGQMVASGGAQVNGVPFARALPRLPAGTYTAKAEGRGKNGTTTATVP